MVEQRIPLRQPPEPPSRRPRPSRSQIAARRAIALVVLAGGLGLAVWLVLLAVGSIRDGGSKKTTPTVAAAPAPLKIVFPEGFTRAEMADRIRAVNEIAREKRKINPKLSAQVYLSATERSKIPAKFAGDKKRRNLEGFLFPSTYEFEPQTTSRRLVNQQLEAFQDSWANIDLAYAKSKNLTPYDVLIIASMIEKEVIAPEERALVAAVIYNRLKAGMVLGIDATVRYGLGLPATESLKTSQLEDLSNPYNTRKLPGLPPTPIANPGLASMQAAAHPANVDYLHFVRKPDKIHHFFTASEDEFYEKSCEYGYGCR
jgi:UPF0755 protein